MPPVFGKDFQPGYFYEKNWKKGKLCDSWELYGQEGSVIVSNYSFGLLRRDLESKFLILNSDKKICAAGRLRYAQELS